MPDQNKTKDESPITPNPSVKVTLAWSDIKDHFSKDLKKAARKVKLAGFRQGNVPLKLAKPHVNLEHIKSHIAEHFASEKFTEIAKKKNLKLLTNPELLLISAEEGKDWEVEISYAEAPVIKLGKYKPVVKKALKEAAKKIAEPENKNLEQERAVFQALVKFIKPQIPELMVRHETNHRLEESIQQFNQMKMDIQDYLKQRGMTSRQFVEEKQIQALASLQLEFVLQALTEDLKVKVEDKEIDTQLEEIKDGKIKAQAKKDDRYRAHITRSLERKKTIELLLSL